jgi:hypothetical protein
MPSFLTIFDPSFDLIHGMATVTEPSVQDAVNFPHLNEIKVLNVHIAPRTSHTSCDI